MKYRSAQHHKPFFIFHFSIFIVLVAIGIYLFLLWRGSTFGKFDRFNLVLVGSKVTYISLNTKDKSATVVYFPDDFYTAEVVPNYGGYKMSSVYSVGELDKLGGQVLSWTVFELLGSPVDGYIFNSKKNFTGDIKKVFFDPGILTRSKTNLNYWDLILFIYNLEQIRFDKIKTIDLGNLSGPLQLADGTTVKSLEKENLDNLLSGFFVEQTIQAENFRVEIINPTTVVGLGARAGRILSNIGMSVINVGTDDDQLTNCHVLVGKEDLNSLTVRRIKNIYNCSEVIKETSDRADVTVILGKDYATRFIR